MKLTVFLCGFLITLTLNHSAHSQCLQSISAGTSHSIAIKSDGTLWAWGFNASGQLGDGTTTQRQIPVQVGITADWKVVSAGDNHTLAIKNDGTLWTWGYNQYGQLGDGTFGNSRAIPTKIGTHTDWEFVSAGASFSVAIKADGTLWSWGDNYYGQLGNSSTTFIPEKVGTDTNWKSVSAGGNHVLAIKTDGSLWAWGLNLDNELGDGSGINRNTPLKIGTATNWSLASSGYDFSVAIKTDGTLWTWGNNDLGQLGNGSYTKVPTPTQLGALSDWQSISTGKDNVHAIKTNGTLWTWGWVIGKFGFGTANTKNVPTRIGSSSNWIFVISGNRHSFGFTENGSVWAWGDGTWGKLGLGDALDYSEQQLLTPIVPSATPVQSFCKVATISDLLPAGTNIRWYDVLLGGTPLAPGLVLVNDVKYYASDTKFDCESPSRVEVISIIREPAPAPLGNANQTLCPTTSIAGIGVSGTNIKWYTSNTTTTPLYEGNLLINGSHYFASQTINGCESPRTEFIITLARPTAPTGQTIQTFCQGTKVSALQANGTGIKWYQPQLVSGQITANILLKGGIHFYATQTINGCESDQKLDVLVNLTENNVAAPETEDPLVADKIFTDGIFNGVIDTRGRLWGWGWNGEGQLADGTHESGKSPVLINEGPFYTIGGGGSALLGIRADGSLWAWGLNNYGQLGIGAPNNLYPITRVGIANDWKHVAYVYNSSAAIKNDGTLWTWGQGERGYWLGDGGGNYSQNIPKQLGTQNDWNYLSGGYGFYLTIKANGSLTGWGSNIYGELGDGSNTDRYVPTSSSTSGWRIAKGSYHYSVGIKTDGTIWAWGSNENGTLGDSNLVGINAPRQIGTSTDWMEVSPGLSHVLALKNDGTLWAWGRNNYYQLGNNTTANESEPVQIGDETNWKSVAAGSGYSLAIKSDGSIWSWGANSQSQLGHGTTANIRIPARIQAGVQYVCSSSALADLTPIGANINWYSESWYANTSVLDPIPPKTLLINKKHYYATQMVNGCESPLRLTLFVQFNTSTIAPPTGTALQTFCNSATVAKLQATGSKLKWYASSVGGNPLLSQTALTHNTIYYASQTIDGCESILRFEVNVTLENNNIPSPLGEQTQTLCANSSVDDLVAMGSSIKWYEVAMGGTPLLPSAALISASHYYASQMLDECESTQRLDVTVYLNAMSSPIGNATQTFCNEAMISDLSVTGSSIQWYATSIGGTVLPANTLLVNNNLYFASQTSGSCESVNRLAVTVNIKTSPSPIGNTAQSFCNGARISDLIVTGSGVLWYATSTLGSALSANTILVHNNQYFASQNSGGCESFERLEVLVVLNPIPPPPKGEVTPTYENGQAISDIALSGVDIKWYASAMDAFNHTNMLQESEILKNGVSYFATQTISGCESSPFEITPLLITGLERLAYGLTFFPNPVKQTLSISLNEMIDKVTVSSLTSQSLISKDVNDMATVLDLSMLANGMYLIHIKVKQKTIIAKIVKE